MIWKGTRCSSKDRLKDVQEYINSQLAKRYAEISIVDDRRCFLLDTGEILSITCMFGNNINALCTEYSDNVEEMKKYNTTDGDLYPLDDFDTPEDMLGAMLAEIEN